VGHVARMGRTCEHGSEASDAMKGWKFQNRLSDYQHIKKNFAPWSFLFIKIIVLSFFSFLFISYYLSYFVWTDCPHVPNKLLTVLFKAVNSSFTNWLKMKG
jgi:hypothetical protein